MTLDQIVEEIKAKPYMFKQGRGYLAKRLGTTPEIIMEAKKKAKSLLNTTSKPVSGPRILILDIETSPMQAYVWKRWKENISLDQTISEWFMICWSAKWLGETDTFGDCCIPDEIQEEDDMRICYSLWNVLNEAEIVIAHNGSHFDIPMINSRFAIHGFLPPSPYKQIDTLDVAKRSFKFSSNKLDALAGYFNIEHKDPTDFKLWKACMEGSKKALDYMFSYNKKDVEILEKVYLKIRPWIKNHPNLATISMDDGLTCPICGGHDVIPIPGKFAGTSVGQYQAYRCRDCFAVVRGREKINDKVQLTTVN